MKGIQIKINSTILYGTSYRTKYTAWKIPSSTTAKPPYTVLVSSTHPYQQLPNRNPNNANQIPTRIGPSRQIHRHPDPSALWSDPQVPNRCIMESSTTILYRNGECKSFYTSQKKSHSYLFHMNDIFALIRYQKRKVAIKLPATLRAGSVIITNPGYLLSCVFWVDISLNGSLAEEYCIHGSSIYFVNFTLDSCRWRRRSVSWWWNGEIYSEVAVSTAWGQLWTH